MLQEYRRHIKEAGVEQGECMVTPESLHDAAKAYPDTKAKGVDGWSPKFLSSLPLKALAGLSEVLSAAQASLMWPAQIMFNLMVCCQNLREGNVLWPKLP